MGSDRAVCAGWPEGPSWPAYEQPALCGGIDLDDPLGRRWRDLPERYGAYQTVKRRYYRWIGMGILEKLFAALSEQADVDWGSRSIPPPSAPNPKRPERGEKGGADAQGLGRSRGGLGTKIDAAVDALGLPIRFVLSPAIEPT